ncbi:MAG: hypothetical protein NT050_03450 [Verrucomicrobia bacterium]|nr:hypothetical protein [Verrucomicrobiota bacterium]
MQRARAFWLLWTTLIPALVAEEIVTLDGRTFRETTLRRLDEDRLELQHSGGRTTVFFFEVPEPLRRRLGFDTEAALKRLTLENSRLRGTTPLPSVTASSTSDSSTTQAKPMTLPRLLAPAKPVVEALQTARWAGLVPPAPAAQLPPVTAAQEISVWELVNHYRSDLPAANARYQKRSFRITGVVERMERGIVSRNVRVFLETPDPAVRPVCEWRIDDKIPAFHTRRDGRTLIAENNRSKWQLLEAGQTVTFEVRAAGMEDGLVELKQARLQP